MTSRPIVALRAGRQQRLTLLVGGGVTLGNFLFVLSGTESLLVAATVSGVTLLGLVRWRGDVVVSHALRALHLFTHSRFHAVQVRSHEDGVTINCRGERTVRTWCSSHRGRPDLSDRESEWWSDVLRRMSVGSIQGAGVSLSCHFRGFGTPQLATQGFELGEPWEIARLDVGVPEFGWMYETWKWVRTPEGFSRAYAVDDLAHLRGNLIAGLSDADERWSVHVHFVAHARQHALRRTRRSRHEATAASLWKVRRGRSVSPLLVTNEDVLRWHEEQVADGAALIDFRCYVIISTATLDQLATASQDLTGIARRRGVQITVQHGQHARAVAASWVGVSPW